MKIFAHFPTLQSDKEDFENRVATFQATLFIEKIKELKIPDNSKKKLLNSILKALKN